MGIAEADGTEHLADAPLRDSRAEHLAFHEAVAGGAGNAVGERPADVDPEFPRFHEGAVYGIRRARSRTRPQRPRPAGPRTGWHHARSYSPGEEGFGCRFVEVMRARTYRSSSSNV